MDSSGRRRQPLTTELSQARAAEEPSTQAASAKAIYGWTHRPNALAERDLV